MDSAIRTLIFSDAQMEFMYGWRLQLIVILISPSANNQLLATNYPLCLKSNFDRNYSLIGLRIAYNAMTLY